MNQVHEIRLHNERIIGKIGSYVVGMDCQLNDATIDTTGGVTIGDRVHFGHQVMILTTVHPPEIRNGKERSRTIEVSPIHIEKDAYIGSRAIILKGVTIGKGSYIGAGSSPRPAPHGGREPPDVRNGA